MQFTSLSKSVRSIGLIGMFSAIAGMSMRQIAQAQSNKPVTCSAAYFDNPDYMYNPSGQEKEAVDRFNADPARIKRLNDITIEVGVRPDFDKRLREDKTGATFFK